MPSWSVKAAFIGLCVLQFGCSNAFIPYAVDDLQKLQPTDRSLPIILSDPIAVTKDYQLYKSMSDGKIYCIPALLTLSNTPEGRRQAVSLETDLGDSQILVANLAPPASVIKRHLPLYPVQRLDVRPITGTMDPTRFRVTVVPGAISRAPFSSLILIQVFGHENITGFKSLLQSGAGFLLEAHFEVALKGFGTRALTIPVSLDQAGVTEQTL
jgi:hypothetical protein